MAKPICKNLGGSDLEQILQLYFEAAEQGRAPERQSFLDQHPAFADELQSFFADVQHLEKALGPRTQRELKISSGRSNSSTKEISFAPGETVEYIGGYRILQELARGGMGVVYKARQESLSRTVALKMILAGQFAGEREVRRFQAEAEAAARLEHPAIVPIYEIGEFAGHHYFAMGYIPGPNLAEAVDGELFPAEKSARMLITICNAVACAHDRGVIHRDLKPANILLDQYGQPKVADFGLAKCNDAGTCLTEVGQVLGTPEYMSPEQASGEGHNVGPNTDIYSLGGILYFLLTGRPPFHCANPARTVLSVLTDEPKLPTQLRPATPRDLEAICLKCLQKEPEARYASAREVAADLQRFLDGLPVSARRVGQIDRAWRWCKRHPVTMATPAFSLPVLILALVLVGSNLSRSNTSASSSSGAAFRSYKDEIADRERTLATIHRQVKRAYELEQLDDLDQARLVYQLVIRELTNLVDAPFDSPLVVRLDEPLAVSHASLLVRLADLEKRDQRASAERAALETLIALSSNASVPMLAADWELVGDAYFRLRRWAHSRDAYQHAIRAKGESEPTATDDSRWWRLAATLAELDEVEEAKSIYAALVESAEHMVTGKRAKLHRDLAERLALLPPTGEFSPWLSEASFLQVYEAMTWGLARPPRIIEGRADKGQHQYRAKFGPQCGVRWHVAWKKTEEEYRRSVEGFTRKGFAETSHQFFLDGAGNRVHSAVWEKWPVVAGHERVEAETFGRMFSGNGRAFPQTNMRNFPLGSWTEDTHLLWLGVAVGDELTLGFQVAEAGEYEIRAAMTEAPGFSIVDVALDDAVLRNELDLSRSKVVSSTGPVTLGSVVLEQGSHQIRFAISGWNRSRSFDNRCFGIDFVEFLKHPEATQ